MLKREEPFKLYLASWQIRMANDFLPKKIKEGLVTIIPGGSPCPYSYKIPVDGISKRDWILYLTDEQMLIVKKQFNLKTAIPSINITEKQLKNKVIVFG